MGETLQRLAGLVDSAMDAIVSVDEDQRIVVLNPAAEEMFGYAARDVLGTSINRLIPPRFHAAHQHHIRQFERTGSTGRRMGALGAIWGLRKDGVEFPIEASISQADDGEQVLFTVILRDITERFRHEAERKASEEQLRLLSRELSHRSKNLLAIIDAVARMTLRASRDLDEFSARFSERLQGLARSHDLLVEHHWEWTPVGILVHAHLTPFLADQSQMQLSGPDVYVDPVAAQNLGLALHELATNAVKYGALSTGRGNVDVVWTLCEGDQVQCELRLVWRERGGPAVKAPARRGFGRTVVEHIVSKAIDGRATLDFDPGGVVWTLDIPATRVRVG